MASMSSKQLLGAARPFAEIPGPAIYPLIGNAYQYILGTFDKEKYHEALKSLHQQYGPVVRQKIGGKFVVHVFDPEDIKTVIGVLHTFWANLLALLAPLLNG